jgi:hypothetical protein
VQDVIGVILFVVFILLVIATAAGVTWLVVKLSPPKSSGPTAPPAS